MIGGNVTNYERGVEDVITWLKTIEKEQGKYKEVLGRTIRYSDFPTLIRKELLEPHYSPFKGPLKRRWPFKGRQRD